MKVKTSESKNMHSKLTTLNQSVDAKNAASELHRFLESHQVKQGQQISHTSMYGGSFHIPFHDLDEFFTLYEYAFMHDVLELSIVERHIDVSPILIDLDFRQNKDDIQTHITDEHIQNFCDLLMDILRKYVNFESCTCDIFFVVMKKPPRVKNGVVKDGLHIMAPEIVTSHIIQTRIRQEFLEYYPHFFHQIFPYNNSAQNIYDENVIKKSGSWLMYGSKKPDELHSWKSYCLVSYDNAATTTSTLLYGNGDKKIESGHIRQCSIRIRFAPVDYTQYGLELQEKAQERLGIQAHDPLSKRAGLFGNASCEYAIELAKILSPRRAQDYNTWISVGWCLFNINYEKECDDQNAMLNAWINFSMKCPSKFVEGECEKFWNSTQYKVHGLNMGSLVEWVKEDDLEAFRKIPRKDVLNEIVTSKSTKASLARILVQLVGENFVAVSTNSDKRVWYMFNGVRWIQDTCTHHFDRLVTNDVVAIYRQIAGDYRKSALRTLQNSGGEDTERVKDEVKRLLDISKKVECDADKLEEPNIKHQIFKEVTRIIYDESFMDKLDIHPHLIGFNNGVYDLIKCQFRSGKKDDFVSMTTGYDFIPEKNNWIYSQVDDFWKKIHTDPEKRNYTIKMFSRQIMGDNCQSLFHVHCGCGANGKTAIFNILQSILGTYTCSFQVDYLTNPNAIVANAPNPDFAKWRGKRIMYCSEPVMDNGVKVKLASATLKRLSGEDTLSYRLCHMNDVVEYKPKFKLHMQANDAPDIDGGDTGLKRRVRRIDYNSRFVVDDEVDESRGKFLQDTNVIHKFENFHVYKMEFMRYLLDHFDINFVFKPPKSMKEMDQMYLENNDKESEFLDTYVQHTGSMDDFFTLNDLNSLYRETSWYIENNRRNLYFERVKNILFMQYGNSIKIQFERYFRNKRYRRVFSGLKIIVSSPYEPESDNISDH